MKFFKIIYQSRESNARLGKITTPHGTIKTPAFVPVGTNATVKGISPRELQEVGAQIFFANTYHLLLRPGVQVVKKAGGIHRFCGWNGPIITDSGGFQVFSLGRKGFNGEETLFGGKRLKITNQGVYFRSPLYKQDLFLDPEKSIKIQHDLGADLIVAFDDCTPYPISFKKAASSLEKTHRWAEKSLATHKKLGGNQLLYGVVQGSYFKKLRQQSAKFIASLDFDGIAIGGVSVGEPKRKMRQAVSWIMPLLPKNKPRHLLGVGQIDDIFDFVKMGIDTLDCVIPTRLGRMGKALISGKTKPIDITKKSFAYQFSPLDKTCSCYTCRNFSLAYLNHLFRTKELLAYRLLTIHNLNFFTKLMREIRKAIKNESLGKLQKEFCRL